MGLSSVRFIVYLVFASISCWGQQDSLVSEQLDSVLITAGRMAIPYLTAPAALTIVDMADRIDYTSHTDLSEVVSQVPGLFALNGQNYAQDLRISLRGFGARSAFGIRGIKLVVDGIPETTPDGQGQLDNVSVADITGVQILQGTNGSQYGNASGGVIEISTDTDQDVSQASMRIGSYGLQQYRLSTNQSFANTKLQLAATHQRSDGYRDHSQLRQTNLLGKLSQSWAHQSIAIRASLLTSPMAQDPGGVNLDQATSAPRSARDRNVSFDAGEEITHWKTSVKYDNQLNKNFTLSATTFYSGRSFDGRLPFGNGGAIDLNRKYGGLMLQVQQKVVKSNLVSLGTFGVDLLSQRDSRDRFVNNDGERGEETLSQLEKFDNFGLYVIRQLSIDQWTLRGSLRYDINNIGVDDSFLSDGDASDSETLPSFNYSIGANYNYSEKQAAFVSYSTSFETPTLSELGANPSGAGGFNDMLDPARARTIEIGLKGSASRQLNYALTFFNINTTNELLPFEIADQPGRTFFRNAGQTNRSGLEVDVTYSPSTKLDLQVAYTYSNFKFDEYVVDGEDLSDIQLPGIPKTSLSTSITYSHHNLYLRATSQYFSRISVRDDNTVGVDPYHIVNLRLGHKIKAGGSAIKPFIGINNLFSSTYFDNLRLNAFGSRHYEPAAEINVQVGVGVEF